MILRFVIPPLVFCATSLAQDGPGFPPPNSGGDTLRGSDILFVGSFAPVDSARMLPIHPRFTWPDMERTSPFVLRIASDPAMLSVVHEDSTLVDTSWQCPVPLQNSTRYFWSLSWRKWSDDWFTLPARSFETAPPPAFTTGECAFRPTKRDEASIVQVVLSNPVAVPITVDSVLKQTAVFDIRDSLPVVIPANDSIRLSAVFSPSSFKTYRDTLTIATSQGAARLFVTGESPPPILGVAVADLKFAPIRIADTSVMTIPLRNLGTVNSLSIRGISTCTPYFTPSRESPVRVEAGNRVVLGVRFHPKAIREERFGAYVDTLVLVSDGGTARVVLWGETPPPRIVASLRAIDFGLVGMADTATAVLQIRNPSLNTLRIDSIMTTRRMFRPGVTRGRVVRTDSFEVSVSFTPERYGPWSDTLILLNNSWTSPLRVPLKGYSPYPVLQLNFDRVNFGIVEKGDSGSVDIRIWNSSISSLRLDTIRTRLGQFRVRNIPLPGVLRRGASATIRVDFFPDSLQTYRDTLLILSSAEERRRKIPLLGEGAPARGERTRSDRSMTFEVYQNYPNPFSTNTTFSYNLPVRSRVRVEVYAALGELIAIVLDGEQGPGVQHVPWSANLPSGIYFLRLYATSLDNPGRIFSAAHKMVVVR